MKMSMRLSPMTGCGRWLVVPLMRRGAGWPVYVHAKVVVIDDWYATIGSDNINRRSWSHDSELAALVVDESGTDHSPFARSLRLRLAAEHLDRPLSGPEHDAAMAEAQRRLAPLVDNHEAEMREARKRIDALEKLEGGTRETATATATGEAGGRSKRG